MTNSHKDAATYLIVIACLLSIAVAAKAQTPPAPVDQVVTVTSRGVRILPKADADGWIVKLGESSDADDIQTVAALKIAVLLPHPKATSYTSVAVQENGQPQYVVVRNIKGVESFLVMSEKEYYAWIGKLVRGQKEPIGAELDVQNHPAREREFRKDRHPLPPNVGTVKEHP